MAEVPPLIGVLLKAGLLHDVPKETTALMGCTTTWIGCRRVVIRLRDSTDRINGTTHVQRQPLAGIDKGEVHGSPGAMRRWHGGIPTGCSPEASNVADDSVDSAALSWILAIDSSLKAERLNRVLHHEGLHRNRTPRIKNAKPSSGERSISSVCARSNRSTTPDRSRNGSAEGP